MMPSVCLSVALFYGPKYNIQRILWTSCFRFNASKACWTVWVACANYNSNTVSLPVCLSCAQLHVWVVCVCVCTSSCPQRTLTHLHRSHHSCSFRRQEPATFLMGVCELWDMWHGSPSPRSSSSEITFNEVTLNLIYSNNVKLKVIKMNMKG